MSDYKIITDADEIILKKKNNKYKLEAVKKIKMPCNIIELVENLEIYNLLKLLNENLINKYKIINNNNNNDIILFLSDISNNETNTNSDSDSDSDSNETEKQKKYYISFTDKITKINSNEIIINGLKNDIKVNLDDYKKLEIDNILIYFKIENSELQILLKFNYIGEKIPIYMENLIGLIFRKIFKNLIKYYSN